MNRKIYLSSSIYTSESAKPISGAVVIEGVRILYVGDKQGAEIYMEGAEVEDLGSRTITPGLIDCHTHAYNGAIMSAMTSHFVSPDFSEEELIQDMKNYISENKETRGGFYLFFMYDPEKSGKFSKYKLDEIFGKDVPVVLTDLSFHGGAFSSKALEKVGYDSEAPIPKGSHIEWEEDGTLGYVSETLYFQFFSKIYITEDKEITNEAINFVQDLFNSNGFTTIIDMLPIANVEIWNEEGFKERVKNGSLTIRVGVCTDLEADAKTWMSYRERLNGDFLFHCGLKGFVDGGFTNSTAWISIPYTEGPSQGTYGQPVSDMDLYRKKIKEANDLGFGVRLHAEGDRAVSEAISMFGESSNVEAINQVEHATAMTDDVLEQVIEYLKRKKLCFNMQPIFLYNEAPSEDYPVTCGIKFYNDNAVRVRSAVNTGANVSLGSTDYPVTMPIAKDHIRIAVNRLSDEECSYYYKTGYMMEETITLSETLQAMTKNAAFSIGKQDCLGLLKKDFKADITIFDCDLFAMGKSEYLNISIYKTIVDGREVYRKQ